jgi:hypothetical protein
MYWICGYPDLTDNFFTIFVHDFTIKKKKNLPENFSAESDS